MKIKANKNLVRKHEYDAGIDIPVEQDVVLLAGKITVIDLGLSVDIPIGHAGILISRTSSAKKGLIVAMSPIDTGYTGTIHAIVYNINTVDLTILKGESICQLVIFPIALVDLSAGIINNDRGSGKFGSTGK